MSKLWHGEAAMMFVLAFFFGYAVPLTLLAFRAWPQAWRVIREVKARGALAVAAEGSESNP